MAKRGFRIMDSDLHTMEPDDLWQKYLAEPFRKAAPTFTRGGERAPNQPTIQVGGLTVGEMSEMPASGGNTRMSLDVAICRIHRLEPLPSCWT